MSLHAIRIAGGAAIVLFVTALAIAFASVVLTLILYRPEGIERLASDWARLSLSHALKTGADPADAFNRLYGKEIGRDAPPEQIRAWSQGQLESGSPLVLDAVMTAYLRRSAGGLDGRSLPPGVYVGAGPIGPDVRPLPVVSHFFFFPRHGHVLIVPFPNGDEPSPAIEVTASVDRDFDRAGRPAGDLFAVRDVYEKGAFDFARPAVPIHDLFVVTREPDEVGRILDTLDDAVARGSAAELPYQLFRRNSNSALGCFLVISGVPRGTLDRLEADQRLRPARNRETPARSRRAASPRSGS